MFEQTIDIHVKPWSQDWLIAAGAYPSFCGMKRLGVFLLPLDGMLVHCRTLPRNLLGFPNNLPVPIYTPGWRETLWEKSDIQGMTYIHFSECYKWSPNWWELKLKANLSGFVISYVIFNYCECNRYTLLCPSRDMVSLFWYFFMERNILHYLKN